MNWSKVKEAEESKYYYNIHNSMYLSRIKISQDTEEDQK